MMRRVTFRAVLAVATVLVATSSPLHAQEFKPGSPVRATLTGRDAPLEGRLVRLDRQWLVVESAGNEVTEWPRAEVATLEVGTRRSYGGAGAALGAVTGVVIALVQEGGREPRRCEGFGCVDVGPSGPGASALAGALLGGAGGWLLGSLVRTTEWTPVVGPTADPSGRVELGIHLAF